MASYCVGCDNIVGGEKKIISKVAKVLKDAGHDVEQLSVGPNHVQSKGLSNNSKGKIAKKVKVKFAHLFICLLAECSLW